MIVYARAHTHTHTHTSTHTQAHTHMHSVIKFGPEVECVVLTRLVVVAHQLYVGEQREGGREGREGGKGGREGGREGGEGREGWGAQETGARISEREAARMREVGYLCGWI
jgi:hypothetical protein